MESSNAIPNTALREIRSLQILDHPNVIRLHEVLPQGSGIVFVFDFMEGDLSHVLGSGSPVLESHAKGYMGMLLRGLAYCHSNCIIHRDLKPSNLLISKDGVLKIADFGLAKGAQYLCEGKLYSSGCNQMVSRSRACLVLESMGLGSIFGRLAQY